MEKSIWTEEYQQLSTLLRQLRRDAGLTQAEVARRLDVAQSFVSKYESGERRLDVIEFLMLAEIIGFDPLEVVNILLTRSAQRRRRGNPRGDGRH